MKAKLTKHGFGADYRGAHCRLVMGGWIAVADAARAARKETP